MMISIEAWKEYQRKCGIACDSYADGKMTNAQFNKCAEINSRVRDVLVHAIHALDKQLDVGETATS